MTIETGFKTPTYKYPNGHFRYRISIKRTFTVTWASSSTSVRIAIADSVTFQIVRSTFDYAWLVMLNHLDRMTMIHNISAKFVTNDSRAKSEWSSTCWNVPRSPNCRRNFRRVSSKWKTIKSELQWNPSTANVYCQLINQFTSLLKTDEITNKWNF